MPGLTLNTEAAAASTAAAQSATNRTSAAATTNSNTSTTTATRAIHSTTPIPVPVPYTSREQPQPQSQTHIQNQTSHSRSSSPARPTYSPITPPLKPTALPPRPTYTHSSHVDATAGPAPPLEPIDFDSNPDVLALKSAISILQMQRRKAERDMATLDRVKSAALAQPEAFVQDLTAGRVRVEGEGLFGGGGGGAKDEESDSDSDDCDGEDKSNNNYNHNNNDDEAKQQIKSDSPSQPNIKRDLDAKTHRPDPPSWASIPKPQNIVRCPPINWSQYAVVGESLDKLHNEQVLRPAQGTPAVLMPEGRFEFKGGDGGGVGKQERYVGVAAPYAPGKDKIFDRKLKVPPK
ncbi:hypothetical protein HD806DRAFT_274251 [Xylariaceae sp. AK1471]|nr:hypothetical protein HD806DRAFT_274251 [Xylariaceae sp. AK1471]